MRDLWLRETYSIAARREEARGIPFYGTLDHLCRFGTQRSMRFQTTMQNSAKPQLRIQASQKRDDSAHYVPNHGENHHELTRDAVIADRRAAGRYALNARVIFGWIDHDRARREARGNTRDVGRKGAYVLATEFPPPGTAVALSILLPAITSESGVLRIDSDACVVRVEPAQRAGSSGGFAVAIHRTSLHAACDLEPSGKKTE